MSGPLPKSPIISKMEQVLWDCWNTGAHALDVVATVVVNTVTFTPTHAAPAQALVTVTSHGTPVALGGAVDFQSLTLIGNKSASARTANTGDIYLGKSGVAGTQPIVIAAGKSYTLTAPIGQKYQLADWFIDAANDNDGAVILYT
jgi:hypothetical protein